MIEVYMFVANWQQPFLAFPAMKARAAEIKHCLRQCGGCTTSLHTHKRTLKCCFSCSEQWKWTSCQIRIPPKLCSFTETASSSVSSVSGTLP